MGRFLYFVPGVDGFILDKACLERWGLAGVFRGAEVKSMGGTIGPEGYGLLFCQAGEAERLGYDAKAQRWEKSACGRFWLGAWQDDLPTPESLLRPEADRVPGAAAVMGNGQEWEVPVARHWLEHEGAPGWCCALEHSVRKDAAGELVFNAIVPRMAELWREAAEIADVVFAARAGAGGSVYQLGDWHARLVRLLAVNYRLGPAEADFLGLVSLQTAGRAFDVLVDVPGFNAVAALLSKKNSGGPGP